MIFEKYRMRDSQEKYFEKMKGIIMDDRNRVSKELSKGGRLLICFVALSIVLHQQAVEGDTRCREVVPHFVPYDRDDAQHKAGGA